MLGTEVLKGITKLGYCSGTSVYLVPGNDQFESHLGHFSVVTVTGHDYPQTLHLHTCTALQFREMFVLYI